jgi:flagellar protein FlaH
MLGMRTTVDATTTGVKDIAEALGGGIRENSLILIEGEAKSGKSVLTQHIAHGVLSSKECSVAYYTTEHSAEELIAQMSSMSLDSKHDFVTDRLRIYSVGSNKFIENGRESLQRLTNHISKLPERFQLLIIDSVTTLMTRVSPVVKVDFLQACKELCEQGRSVILVMDTHVLEVKILQRIYSMSDYYLKLRSQDVMLESGQVDTRVIKILEVTKLGGAERREQEDIKFEIKPKVGIQILPFLKVRV